MRQSKCGCWQAEAPKRRPWYYKRGDWTSWKPVSLGGDEWCRRTVILGIGPVTGVLIVPLHECGGCEDCGSNILNGVPYPEAMNSNEAAEAWELDRFLQAEWERRESQS